MFSRIAALAAVAVASTALAAPQDPGHCTTTTAPLQIRVAYAGEKSMAVSWNTNSKLANPTVYYGKDQNKLNSVAQSNVSTTYPTSSTFNNHVVLDHLEADTTYYYRPSCGTETYTFTTPRRAGEKIPFSFAMVGDMGTFGPDGLSTTVGKGGANPLKPGDLTTIQSLTAFKDKYDFIWHVGDIAYADSWLKEEKAGYVSPYNVTDNGAEYDKILNEFYDEVEGLSRTKPYMVGPGNHEANCDNGSDLGICLPGQLNFTGYRQHWNMPSASSGGVENFWYSFDHGMVHFVMFNTETDFPNAPDEPNGEGAENAGPFAPSGAQLAWLKKDLASVDRKKTPWVVAAGHRPWYVSNEVCTECQSAFEPLLVEYGVDLVLHGHQHFYERHAAIANGVSQEITANPNAPWYIINGAGGHYDGLDTPNSPYVNTSRKVIVAYGWSLFTVHNCTHLSTQFISSSNNTVLDTATLIKDRKC
ncbi:hypothetical protein VTK56DRAFT_8904 [Thermocarpiscus australiensis]